MLSRQFAVAVIALSAGLYGLGPRPASADLMFNLTAGNSGLNGYTGPFAQVDVHLTNSTHATISFTSLTNGGNIYLLGDGGSVAVNVNATKWKLGGITGSNAGTGFTPGPWSNTGAGNEDGWGSFNQTIKSFDGFAHSSDTISFDLTDKGGGTWASAADVLTPNAGGYLAAAHIFITSFPANAANGALTTGFTTDGAPDDPTPVPEPSSLAILGFAIGFLGALLGRRVQRRWLRKRGAAWPIRHP